MDFDLQILEQHFPELTDLQKDRFAAYANLIAEWNEKINLISRADIENLPKKHLLHSLAIAKAIQFKDGTRVMDVGTGGGFPGIPLAILFPECGFHLVDSIGKKVKVVVDCVHKLGLDNVSAEQARAEKVSNQYDFIVARAVTQLPRFMNWIRKRVKRTAFNDLPNGVLYLKGGKLDDDFASIKETPTAYPIQEFFDYDEFQEKYVIHIPVSRD
jgi:16S rRNA (guanine527-N7)-methyltransferase|tara:strand:- start:440 stop:1081 length:642 start_codon:yes stop_codon:yes gene_type:complete